MKMKSKLYVAAFSLMLASGSSWGTLFQSTVSGLDGAGEAVSASATFDVTDGKIIITLTNTLSAILFKSAGQALSDISFVLNGAPGSLTDSSASGQFGDVAGDSPGTVTYVSSDSFNGDGSPLRWLGQGNPAPGMGHGTFSINNVTDTILMETIGGGAPSQMISPFVANGGQYPISNASISGANSFVIGSGTFELDLTGVTANTTITSVTFSFGTTPDTFLTGTTPVPIEETPEPNSLALLGFAGLLVGFIARRRRVS